MHLAAEIGPFLIDFKGFFKGNTRKFGGNRTNASCGNANAIRYGLRCVISAQVTVDHGVKDRVMGFPISLQDAVQIWFDT